MQDPPKSKQVRVQLLRDVSVELLRTAGVPTNQAETVAESIVYAHRVGKDTHGVGRLPLYLKKIQAGVMAAVTGNNLIKDSKAISVLDAANGFGQVAATKAMQLSIEKAKKLGIGAVGVRNSNSFGTAGFIAEQARAAGLIGVVLGNSGPAIAPTGTSVPLFGTNPVAVALPNPNGEFPIVLDMAMSEVARSKIRQAAKAGEKIPFGWALDSGGNPTDDPEEAIAGTMLPIGGHKGYGLALVIDVIAGLLPGAAFGGGVKPLGRMDSYSNYGHFCLAIDITHFMSEEDWADKMIWLTEMIRATGGNALLPGETSFRNSIRYSDMVPIQRTVVDEINGILNERDIKNRDL
jgi:L-2-hydroxycarboxylate dehydrogenase (NAD+)